MTIYNFYTHGKDIVLPELVENSSPDKYLQNTELSSIYRWKSAKTMSDKPKWSYIKWQAFSLIGCKAEQGFRLQVIKQGGQQWGLCWRSQKSYSCEIQPQLGSNKKNAEIRYLMAAVICIKASGGHVLQEPLAWAYAGQWVSRKERSLWRSCEQGSHGQACVRHSAIAVLIKRMERGSCHKMFSGWH